MKSGRLLPLCALALWGLFSCKALPQAEPSGGVSPEYGDEGFGEEDRGGYDYEGWDMPEEEPSLALPPGLPDDAWPGDLIEPSWESGEAFLPDSPPEESALVLAEPLPEPVPPDLTEAPPPEPAGEPSPEGELAGDLSAPREPAAPEEPLASEETAAAGGAAGDEAPAAG
ncbi:MAG: hypothetical protein LBU00_06860, partial [Treponema sp.]|nr:hypothetical protein [Treponema sp.]